MKKIMIMFMGVALMLSANASVEWSWWCENSSSTPDVSLGLGSECAKVSALEFDLFYSGSPCEGLQWTWLGVNNSDDIAVQLAFLNVAEKSTFRMGAVNVAKSNICDLGFLNFSDDAKFQLGFLNFNKNGFLPVFIIVNFDKSIFD